VRSLLERLEEATYARDAAVRQRAQRFTDDLLAFLSADPDALEGKMKARADWGFEVQATAFTKALPRPLTVILLPRTHGITAQVETYDDQDDALVLFCLYQGGDLSDVTQHIDRSTVIHEVTHLLDPGRTAPTNRDQGMLRRQSQEAYFNSPGEWNAYWQEGAARLERALAADRRSPAVRARTFGDGTLRGLQANVARFWDPRLLRAMDPRTQRKFDKRLAALWAELRVQGLL
jgi:hypothetical protein